MASDKYLLLLCAFSCLCCVMGDLNLSEGSPCVKNGIEGTCIGIFYCESAALTYYLMNAGFHPSRDVLPEPPEICSIKNNEFVVCCTDCFFLNESQSYRNDVTGPLGTIGPKSEYVATAKCLENFERLPYPCRGNSAFTVEKIWDEEYKCHDVSKTIVFAVGGRDARRWEFSHSALIGYGENVESAQWLCGGSVISERFILTAAHCSWTRALGNISYAALGILKRSDPVEYWKIHKIKRIIIHPKYKSPSKYHDIALLETETEINFGKDVLPACLDTWGQRPNYSAEASGWGRLGHRKALADTLQVVELIAYNETECATLYQPHRLLKHGYDHETQMCFGSRQEIVDTCEGDSGGPLQTDNHECLYTVVGVTSYGRDCGQYGSAGMYTRVSYYVPWIESVVWPEETAIQRKKDNEWLDELIKKLPMSEVK